MIWKQIIFQEETEDLAATEVEKLERIIEGVDYESDDLYREKLAVIKENYFPSNYSTRTAEQTLVEETTGREPIFEDTNDVMSKYVKALSRTLKSK